MNPQDEAPVITIPARRIHKPEREGMEKRGHDKIASGRKQASRKIQEQEATEEIQEALRLGSVAEFLDKD